MSSSLTDIPARGGNIVVAPIPDSERKGLTKKEIAADHPRGVPVAAISRCSRFISS